VTTFIEPLITLYCGSLKPLAGQWVTGTSTSKVQAVLELIKARQIEVPVDVAQQANRVGALIYGLLRADMQITPTG
jgi:hypothetical protein